MKALGDFERLESDIIMMAKRVARSLGVQLFQERQPVMALDD